jgi:nicotinamide-nucleotide adenylyltransferase
MEKNKCLHENIPDRIGNVGLIGRFKPLHNGAYIMLEEACKRADEVRIGIGSSNIHDLRNPFTAEESHDMIDLVLSPRFSNYKVIYVPDFAQIPKYRNGKKWKNYIIKEFDGLDYFISSNPYVIELLKDSYSILPAFDFIPPKKRTCLKATLVRLEMAQFRDWETMVPDPVVKYLKENKIVDRFREEFGLQTIVDALRKEENNFEETSAGEKRNIAGL